MRLGKTNVDDTWFYTHWSGSEIKQVVQKTLAKQERHDDGPYLSRMMFCEMVKGNEGHSTGFGISTQRVDNEHDIVVVDVPNQKVFTVHEDSLLEHRLAENPDKVSEWSFEEFIKLTEGLSD